MEAGLTQVVQYSIHLLVGARLRGGLLVRFLAWGHDKLATDVRMDSQW